MPERRHYTEEDRAVGLAALDAHGGDVSKAARFCQIPRKTLEYWKHGGGVNPQVANLRQEKTADLAEALEEIAWRCVQAIPGQVPLASLKEISTTLGIAIDKMQLLRNKPTQIHQDYADLSDDELDRRIAELEARKDTPASKPDEPTSH